MNKHYVIFTTNGVSIDVYAEGIKHDSRRNKDVILFFNDGKSNYTVFHPIAEFYVDTIAGYIEMDS